jgi:hypothetical protein
MKKEKKYSIVLFCNKKRVRVLYSCMKRTTVYEYWREYRTQVKPRFTKQQTGTRKNKDLIYELALIFPNNRWATDVWVKDSLGRNQKAKIENDKFRIKEIIPYWKEELVYDYNTKKRIRYNQVLDYILTINDIAQIFTLNKNLFVQIENDVRLFGNKNKNDANRLLELLREDILNKKKGNFFFVKDITTHQRRLLYKLLESKGFNKNDLFRHYSY